MAQREIRIYRYTFSEGDPIEIEAESRVQARAMLNKVVYGNRKFYEGKQLWGESVITPLYGITKKMVGGVEWTWVGFEVSERDGWMESFIYDAKQKELKRQAKIIRLKSNK